MSNVFVFRPGAAPSAENVFNQWEALILAMKKVEGRKILEFDDSLQSPCSIPPEPNGRKWPMKDVMWAGFGPRPAKFRTEVVIESGAEFADLRMIGGQVTVISRTTVKAPISDFSDERDHVQIGLRDDCGNTHIVNQGGAPVFDLGNKSALFFVQNCLFGMSTPLVASTFPLIRHTGAESDLTINLLGLNQTGKDLVQSENGALVRFVAISGGAQVAADQSTITDKGRIAFAPIGRIQRQILPLPPEVAFGSQNVTKPNALIRCNGIAAFTQVLPKIRGKAEVTGEPEFTVGQSDNIFLYSGGQELIVAEVAGGRNLTVRPATGDTVDLFRGLVHIDPLGSRTFVSDGVSNWITTSLVRGRQPIFFPLSPDFGGLGT